MFVRGTGTKADVSHGKKGPTEEGPLIAHQILTNGQ